MTPERALELWTGANAALARKDYAQAEGAALELATALAPPGTADPLPPPLNYGSAVGLLANVVLNRDGAQAAVDVFGDALRRMEDQPAGVTRGLVLLNFARLLQYLRQDQHAADSALGALREVDDAARALDGVALGVVFELLTILSELGADGRTAIPMLQAALDAAAAVDPKPLPLIVGVRRRLTRLLLDAERYQDALPHAEFMVAVETARSGADSAEAAEARMNYGLTLDQSGRYREAERQYRRALAALRRHHAGDHPSITLARQNLAELARVRGALDEAEQQFRQLEAEDRVRHPATEERNAQLLINYGQTLIGLSRFDEAADRLNAALEIRAAQAGPQSPRYARVLTALGQLALARGAFQEAVEPLGRAAAIYDHAGRAEDADYARLQESLAAIHLGDPVAAAQRVRDHLARMQRQAGENHPAVVAELEQLLQHEFGALTRSGWTGPLREPFRADLEAYDERSRFALVEALSSLGDRAMRDALHNAREWQMMHLSLLMADAERTPERVDRAWRFVSRYRGAETTALRLRARRYLQYDPTAQRRRMKQVKRQIVRLDLELGTVGEDPQIEADRSRLENELRELEFALAAATNQWRLDAEFIGDAPIVNLDAESAVVVFAGYLRLPAKAGAYAAFVLGPGQMPVRLIDLGEADAVDDAIRRFRAAVAAEGRRSTPDEAAWREPGVLIAQRIFGALQAELIGVRRLRVLADGALTLVPLSALPKADGGFVLNDFDITYDVSLPALGSVLYEEDLGVDAPAAVLGAPAYTTASSSAAAGSRLVDDDDALLSQFRSGARFDPLRHAEDECRAVAAVLEVSPVLGPDANESAFEALRSPEVLHISTHGFFLADGGTLSLVPGRVAMADALDRTGLALAGANDYLDGRPAPQGADDGILYGAEIADCDFMRTDLVTLSACQTGLGDPEKGDGVHGLQRAFLSAGAKTVVCSMWDVPDRPTRELFTRFYARLLAGEPRGDAFQATVRELAAEYPRHPVAWGGFMLLGRTDPLARFTARGLTFASVRWPAGEDEETQAPAAEAERLTAQAEQQARGGDVDGALATLDGGLRLEHVPAALVGKMRYSRAGVLRRSGRFDEALQDYAELDRLPGLPPRLRAAAIFDVGTTFLMAHNWPGAVSAYTRFLDDRPLPADAAMALVNRAGAYFGLEEPDRALADLTTVIESADMPVDQRAKALILRAEHRLNSADHAGAIADADRVLTRGGADADQAAGAYLIKGLVAQHEGRSADALNYYTLAREMPDVSPQVLRTVDAIVAGLPPGQ